MTLFSDSNDIISWTFDNGKTTVSWANDEHIAPSCCGLLVTGVPGNEPEVGLACIVDY